MKLAEIYIEHATLQLDQCFTYRCPDAEVLPGMRSSGAGSWTASGKPVKRSWRSCRMK